MRRASGDMDCGKCSILLADDHPLVRDGMSLAIKAQPGWIVCGEAATVAESIRLVEQLCPDVAVVDLGLADGSGLLLIRHVREAQIDTKILVCSMKEPSVYAGLALAAGAAGYLCKGETTAPTLIEAIRSVVTGGVYLSESAKEAAIAAALRPLGTPQGIHALTGRELEVVEAMARGDSLRVLAQKIGLSEKTIETYRDRARKKLGLKSTAALLRYAILHLQDEH